MRLNEKFFYPLSNILLLLALTVAGCMPGTFKDIPPAEAREMIRAEGEGILILDVRTPQEYSREGHLKNARLIPIDTLEAKVSEIAAYKEKTVIVYCAVGGRSKKGAGILSGKGFGKVYNMAGGIGEWKRLGFETEQSK